MLVLPAPSLLAVIEAAAMRGFGNICLLEPLNVLPPL